MQLLDCNFSLSNATNLIHIGDVVAVENDSFVPMRSARSGAATHDNDRQDNRIISVAAAHTPLAITSEKFCDYVSVDFGHVKKRVNENASALSPRELY